MEISKQHIVDMLRSTGEQEKAQQAEQELPETVDSEQHADLLGRLGVDPKQLLGELGGGLPNL
jgi:hypothetical protein